MEISYTNPDWALVKTLQLLQNNAIEAPSRNGPVLRFAEPVILRNLAPLNRVSVWDVRDANPFFHFMEALWMIAGMNTVKPMDFYNSGMTQYSDDGLTLRGTAYGFKWRHHFGYDQLELAIERLRKDPTDRRVVMTMWDPLGEWRDPTSKDLSCNLQVILGTRPGEKGEIFLDMEVTNRSNDIVYGCLGSNLFHFSFLLEYIAFRCGFSVGHYYQVAFNLHGYLENDRFAECYEVANKGKVNEDTERPPVTTSYMKLLGFEADEKTIYNFVNHGDPGGDPYLQKVGKPLYEAYRVFKLRSLGVDVSGKERIPFAQTLASKCEDSALAEAAVAWLGRRG